MTFFPVAERELRVAARRRGTYRTRFIAALVGLLISAWVFLISQQTVRPDVLGNQLFMALATLAFVYTLIAGVRVTADCLSEEKRDGTLGLLFLTDLRGYDVVLGKLAATSMNSFYGLFAIVPVLAIPMVMGGLALDVFWRVVLVLVNTLFFSLAAGILVSSVSRHEHWAMAGTFMFLLLITAGVPALGGILIHYIFVLSGPSTDAFLWPFLLPSPVFTFSTALNPGTASRKFLVDFWQSLALIHLLGWSCLGLAGRAVRFSWQDRPASVPASRWRERWQRWSYGDKATRLALRAQLLDINPFLWLSGRDRLQRGLVWAVLGLTAAGFVWGYLKWRNEWLIFPVAIATVLWLNIILKSWLAVVATRRLLEIRREDALELLASTPLTVSEILRGHRLAFRRLFGGPFLFVFVVDLLMLWMGLQDTPDGQDRRDFAILMAASMVLLLADYYALIWVGMWKGLSARNFKRAIGATVVRVLVLPWFALVISMTLWSILVQSSSSDSQMLHFILWGFLLGLLTDAVFGWSAHHHLQRQFRTVALLRFQPPATARRWRFF